MALYHHWRLLFGSTLTSLTSQMPRAALLALTALGAFAVSLAEAHHMPGHHGSDAADCDCPTGLELTAAPWVRFMPPNLPNTAVYMTLRNTTDRILRIVAAESPVARVTELHDHLLGSDGVMRMRRVDFIEIPAQDQVELHPGGLHVMLIGLTEPLPLGAFVPVTLYVDGFQDVHINATVRAATDTVYPHHHEHGHSSHGQPNHSHPGHAHSGHGHSEHDHVERKPPSVR